MAIKKTGAKKSTANDGAEAKTTSKSETGKTMKTTKTDIRRDGLKSAERKRAAKPKVSTPPPADESSPAAAVASAKPVKAGIPEGAPNNLLARAEADMTRLLESLNTQMTAAMNVFTELAAAQRGKHEAVIRTKPLDRATSMFQRLVTELVDERIGEILPTVVALRSEMDQRARAANGSPSDESHREFLVRGTEMLDQVLGNLDVHAFEPRVGDAFDPLIHLAVGEANQPELANDVVAEVFQQGFRSVRGRVIAAARVKVNRR